MSDLIDLLFSAQNGQLVSNLAQRFGLSDEQMDNAVKSLAPALAIGLRNAAEQPSGFEKLIGALTTPENESAYDQPDAAHADDTVARSRELLSDLFGSPAAAGQVVQVAARDSGLRPDILSQLLPVLASVLLGGLFKNVNNQGLGGILGQLANSGALGPILEQVLGGGGRAAPPQPEPMPMPMPRQGGGGLGGLLGGILGSLLGGGRRPPPGYERGGGPIGGGPIGAPSGGGTGGDILGGGPAGPTADFDPAQLQQAIEQIKKTLQVGQGGGGAGSGAPSANAGGHADLESILGQMFGKR